MSRPFRVWALTAMTVLFLATMAGPALAASDDDGEELYLSECAGCHGPHGEGTAWAPEILEEGAAGADFMMRSGRMPLRHPDEPVRRGEPTLTPGQISAITIYVTSLGGPPVPEADPKRGDIGLGAETYLSNCAACHGSTGVGAALVGSTNAPSLESSSAFDIAEAVRSGPGPMPSFGDDSLSAHQLDSLALYVETIRLEETSHGGWALGRWGPVAEGAAAWMLGIAVVIGSAVWIEGSTSDREDDEGVA